MLSKIFLATFTISALLSGNVRAQAEAEEDNHRVHLSAHGGGWNKYEHIMDKSINYMSTEPKYWWHSAYNYMFGKSAATKKFEADAARFFAKRDRLGGPIVGLKGTKDDLIYVGPVMMGIEQRPMNVIFDTGSDWLTIFGQDCDNCNGTGFQAFEPTTSFDSERRYGSAKVRGREYRAEVCLSFRSCVRDFEYFSVKHQTGFEWPVEGVLGLSQNYSKAMNGAAMVDVGPLLFNALVDNERIREPIFSFYMQKSKLGRSHVDFGRIDKEFIKGRKQDQMMWMGIQKEFFWTIYTWGVGFGPVPEGPDTWKIDSIYSILDTGSSHIFVPSNLWQFYIDKMIEKSGAEVAVKDGYAVTSCNAAWKPIWLIIYEEGQQLEIQPEDYLVDVSENGDGSVCHILMVANNYNFFLYGMPLFQGYYTAHKLNSDTVNTIAWAPHDLSIKKFPKRGPVPTQEIVLPQPNYALVFAVCLLVILILIGSGVAGWASGEYGSTSTDFYIIIAAYSVVAFIMFVIIMVLAGGFLENFHPSLTPPPPTGPDDVDTTTNTDGQQGNNLINVAAIGFVGFFAYKFMALKKAQAARATATEGKEDLMMYTANGMN